jgi:Domain of unknown function (DUF5134)
MIDSTSLRLLLSGVFAVTTAYHLVRAVTAGPAAARVSRGWHALTGVAMIAMLWSWGMSLPAYLGIVVFGGAALWFLFQAGADPRGGGWYHAAMAASMAWMWASMSHPTATMAGTDMAGTEHRHADHLLVGGGVLYLVAAAWFALGLVRARRVEARGAGVDILMAAGMAACFLVAA